MESKRFCPECGKEIIGEKRFCPNCGHALKPRAEQPAPSTPPVTPPPAAPIPPVNQPTPEPTPKQLKLPKAPKPPKAPKQPKQTASEAAPAQTQSSDNQPAEAVQGVSKKAIGIVIGIAVLFVVGVLVFFLKQNGFFERDTDRDRDEVTETAEVDEAADIGEDTEDEEGAEAADAEGGEADTEKIAQAEALVEEASGKIEETDTRGGAVDMLHEAIGLYEEAGKANPQAVEEGINEAWGYYCDAVIYQSDLLFEQGIQKDLYQEMAMMLDEALTYSESIKAAGYAIDDEKMAKERAGLDERYRKMYLDKYNEFINEYQWNVRYNREFIAEATELFATEDVNDPVVLRDAYAYAWLVHQEVVEGINSGEMDYQDAVYYIAERIGDTDYNEFLMQDAEAYTWNSQEGWMNMDYFGPVYEQPIIADSSTVEYSAEDIREMGLNAAELRYARYEIYARHGMKMWDETANQLLHSANTTNGEIAREKFMSYNDFGNFSTDGVNGLTPVERNNIRSIARVEIEDGMVPWSY